MTLIVLNRIFRRCLAGMIFLSGIAVTSSAQSDEEMSDRLRRHVEYLTSDTLQGRKAGTEGERAAAGYVFDRMEEAGVLMLTDRNGQDFSIVKGEGDTLYSRNIIGLVQGYDDALSGEFVVVGASLDHIGINRMTIDGKEEVQVFPGADNNASGVACLIELARQVAATSFAFRRTVIFAAFGASEEGLAGAWYFVNRAFEEADSISAMLDLNMVGRGFYDDRFRYFLPSGNVDIIRTLQNVSRENSMVPPSAGIGMAPSSGYLAFYENGIPSILFTSGDFSDRYSAKDVASRLDYGGMEGVCEYLYPLIMKLSRDDAMVVRTGRPSAVQADSTEDEERIYLPNEVDILPQYFHSDTRHFLQEWVYKYIRYPESALENGIQGTVIVEFIVEKDGSVSNVRALKYPDDALADEAEKVVSISPKWKAGRIGKKQKVRVKLQIPVEFRLQRVKKK